MKTLEKIRKRFWWKRIIPDTKNFVTACIRCQQRKNIPKIVHKEPIHPIQIPNEPFQRIHMDILGPLPETVEGYKYILSITDSFSKWLTAVPMINQTAISISQAFTDNWITKFGCPKVVVTDNGRQFISKIFEELTKIYGFKHNKTTTYHPQSNGAVERMNRVVADMLYNYVNIKGTDWSSHLQYVIFAYNSSIHASSGQTPYFILFARDPVTPIDLRLKGTEIGEREVEMSEYLENKTKLIKETWESVKESLNKAQEQQKRFADLDRKEHKFELFDLVLIQIDHHLPENYHKFRQKWAGPFRVIKIEEPVLTLEEMSVTSIQLDGKIIYPFYGIRYIFSNFYPISFKVWGIRFDSSERAYVYAKAKYFKDFRKMHQVMNPKLTPAGVKRLGKYIHRFDKRQWEKVSRQYMKEIVFEKFNQNPLLARKLLRTGSSPLLEANPYDRYWGIGISYNDLKEGKTWKGENWLGIILMNTRKILREREEEKEKNKPAFLRGVKCKSLEKLREYQLEKKMEELNLND
uniref:RNA-directed DNA polymerase n=1 Tax=Meloidogyne incognita TaxID=6306 RepID=A0A914KP35_MELIC